VLAPSTEGWSGIDVSIAQIEAELARLRDSPGRGERAPHQRTSVMTHVAWVPPAWLDVAERTLEGMAARHPSRTVLLVPEPGSEGGIDAELSVRCFPAGDRDVCGEVIELHLRGDRARAPASIVVPLAIADLPVFLRWRGEPPFAAGHWAELVDLADRVVVDSSEWGELRYAELAAVFERSAVSDIAWARIYPWRVALSRRWPAIRDQEIAIRGPRAEAALLGSWLSARLGRVLAPAGESDVLAVSLAGEDVPPAAEQPRSPSDLLSAELDRTGRDPIYEQAVAAYVAG
jgi:glucose-6-phosphate dehydrogenase assembly protein OpcA